MRVLISGGGTGGHLYPAIAIADALKKIDAEIEILFVGAHGKLEMQKVPAAGYQIEGLHVSGFHRRLTLKNLLFPFKLMKSMMQARKIVSSFSPDVGVGVGGYASGPAMRSVTAAGIPFVLQEQNSYPGVTNRILSKRAKKICTAYPKMEAYFEADKLTETGNPVRANLAHLDRNNAAAYAHFGLEKGKKTCLVVGGSGGARSFNEAMKSSTELIEAQGDSIQYLWQMGGGYADVYGDSLTSMLDNVHATAFIDRMDLAYSIADLVVARAGALTISEVALTGIPAVFVPSPHVAGDHQTKNAMALVDAGAAAMISDAEVGDRLTQTVQELLDDEAQRLSLIKNLKAFAKPNAANEIAQIVLDVARNKD